MSRAALEDASIGELVSKVTEETSALIRDELRVAQLEMTRKARYAGLGVGMFGAAGIVAGLGLACLVAAAVLGLAVTLSAWLSALIVGLALLLAAGVFALVGKKEITEAMPPLPEGALAGVKLDLDALKP
ncbi:MAG: phage holin family protein [Actinomycetota bacterium]|nr:phage holin family protein [Actinomycetota bacterium]